MTEADWWAAPDPRALIDWLFFDAHASDRKLRLFSVACCRRVEHLAGGAPFPFLLRMLEAFADGQEDEDRVRRAFESVTAWHREREQTIASTQHGSPPFDEVEVVAQRAITFAGQIDLPHRKDTARDRERYNSLNEVPYPCEVGSAIYYTYNHLGPAELADLIMVRLLHDIFGPLPFRDVPVAPAWLTSDVTALARGVYVEKAFDRMPILADALQDAGCDNDEVLNHCRAAGWEHVRGCWVVDLLLGKPWREGDATPG
jgi:hypothetical protein